MPTRDFAKRKKNDEAAEEAVEEAVEEPVAEPVAEPVKAAPVQSTGEFEPVPRELF
jgi:F-type H+-transporting ATPase subunit O